MISLTEKAIAAIKEIAEADAIEQLIIRAKCVGGGCAGFTFDLSFDSQITETDEIFNHADIKVVCDQMSIQYLDGSTIDYVSSLMGSGFKFDVPKAIASCGCQKSFDF